MEESNLNAPFSSDLFSYSTSSQQQSSQGGYNKRMLTKCYNHAGQRQLSDLFYPLPCNHVITKPKRVMFLYI